MGKPYTAKTPVQKTNARFKIGKVGGNLHSWCFCLSMCLSVRLFVYLSDQISARPRVRFRAHDRPIRRSDLHILLYTSLQTILQAPLYTPLYTPRFTFLFTPCMHPSFQNYFSRFWQSNLAKPFLKNNQYYFQDSCQNFRQQRPQTEKASEYFLSLHCKTLQQTQNTTQRWSTDLKL